MNQFGQETKRFKTMLDYYLFSRLGTAGLIFKKESEFLWRKYYVCRTTSILTFWREKSLSFLMNERRVKIYTKLTFQVKIPTQTQIDLRNSKQKVHLEFFIIVQRKIVVCYQKLVLANFLYLRALSGNDGYDT